MYEWVRPTTTTSVCVVDENRTEKECLRVYVGQIYG